MVRFSLLAFATWTFAQVVPGGCMTSQPADTAERGTINTTAATSAGASVEFGAAVTLTASTPGADPAGGAVSYSWLQVAGPGVRIDASQSPVATFAAPSVAQNSTLTFRVTTRNERGDVGFADVSVLVAADRLFGQHDSGSSSSGSSGGSSQLVARAGPDRNVTEKTTATLDGSGSTGSGLTYQWRQTAGTGVQINNGTTVRASFQTPDFVTAGTTQNRYEFELLVRDSAGRTSRDRVVITVTMAAGGGGSTGTLPRVRLETSAGSFTFELESVRAPRTVANFLQYVDDNFYDGLIIHRVVPGFVIQGGGYFPGLAPRMTRDPVQSEASNGLSNLRMTVAMALTAGDPNSGTSQFFINLVDNTFLDEQDFTVFARVVEGSVFIDTIATLPTTTRNGFSDVPVDDILINDVVRVQP